MPVHFQKKASARSRVLWLNLLILPLQLLLAAPLLLSNNPADYASGVAFLLASELILLVILTLLFALIRKPDFNRAWELVLTPYQLSLQNGALPTYLLKSLSYRPKNFFHDSALILNWHDAESLPPIALDMNLPESVYADLCERVNAFLGTHQQAIEAASRVPLSEAIPYMELPAGCRMRLQAQAGGCEVSLPTGFEHLVFYHQTVLINPGAFHAQGRSHLSLSKESLIYKRGQQSYTLPWKDLHAVTLERVKKEESTASASDGMPARRIRYDDELTLHTQAQLVKLVIVSEDAGLRHQLFWLRDLILRQQKESLMISQ